MIKEGKNIDWDELYVKYQYRATSDEPSILFWHEICDFYPHCKVILTMRDANKWYKSYYNAIIKVINNTMIKFIVQRLKHFVPYACVYFTIFKYGLIRTFGCIEGDKAFDKDIAINKYNERNNDIINYFKNNNTKHRLFILNWDRKDKNKMFMELMSFLEIKLSDDELKQRKIDNKGGLFPHKNNTNRMNRDILLYLFEYVIYFILIFVILFLYLFLR